MEYPQNVAFSRTGTLSTLVPGVSGTEGSAITVTPQTAAELHPHALPVPLFDAVLMVVTVTFVVLRRLAHRRYTDRTASPQARSP
jgi:hypothetical protein